MHRDPIGPDDTADVQRQGTFYVSRDADKGLVLGGPESVKIFRVVDLDQPHSACRPAPPQHHGSGLEEFPNIEQLSIWDIPPWNSGKSKFSYRRLEPRLVLECVLQSLEHSQVAASVLSGESNRRRKEGRSIRDKSTGACQRPQYYVAKLCNWFGSQQVVDFKRIEIWSAIRVVLERCRADGWTGPHPANDGEGTGELAYVVQRLGVLASGTEPDQMPRAEMLLDGPHKGRSLHVGLPLTFRRPMLRESIQTSHSTNARRGNLRGLERRAMQASL